MMDGLLQTLARHMQNGCVYKLERLLGVSDLVMLKILKLVLQVNLVWIVFE